MLAQAAKGDLGEAWLLLPVRFFSSSFSSRRFLPAWHVAIVGRFHFIRRKPKKATVLPILDTSQGPFLLIFSIFLNRFPNSDDLKLILKTDPNLPISNS
ncbi:hypothetical protein [Phaeodactylibacter xiamenensis]|uniref:hypothetical protein n=1 Tax=Phaeodactylibacter xiamenensis TaxID=1524460 RepID=UPI003BAACE3C